MPTATVNFAAGLAAGVTEAVAVVTPMEVIKIRLQAQSHSMADPLDVPKYRNAGHALFTLCREEGMGALYRGVSLTALRQGTNQAVNFTVYQYLKTWLQHRQPQYDGTPLPGYQTTLIGLVSGAMGPLSNAPIDTIKTRLQKTPAVDGCSAWRGSPGSCATCSGMCRLPPPLVSILRHIVFQPLISCTCGRQEGFKAFYKGITPRVMRVAPGQAVTFFVYEKLKNFLEKPEHRFRIYSSGTSNDGRYEE